MIESVITGYFCIFGLQYADHKWLSSLKFMMTFFTLSDRASLIEVISSYSLKILDISTLNSIFLLTLRF